jgi:hypothetical protein
MCLEKTMSDGQGLFDRLHGRVKIERPKSLALHWSFQTNDQGVADAAMAAMRRHDHVD